MIWYISGIKTKIDKNVYIKVCNYKWGIFENYNSGYIIGYLKKNKKYKTPVSLHRFIINAKKGEFVDHINGDKYDNRIKNLRICTQSENVFNNRKQKRNTSGYKGVYYKKDHKAWQARITCAYKTIHIGYYKNKHDAAKAYNLAAKKYFGKFARLNKIIKEK